jgi:hypothetical protein
MGELALIEDNRGDIWRLIEHRLVDLQAANKSLRTVGSYEETVRSLAGFLTAHGLPTDLANITKEHVAKYR